MKREYSGYSNNRTVWNWRRGWTPAEKLIIVVVGINVGGIFTFTQTEPKTPNLSQIFPTSLLTISKQSRERLLTKNLTRKLLIVGSLIRAYWVDFFS